VTTLYLMRTESPMHSRSTTDGERQVLEFWWVGEARWRHYVCFQSADLPYTSRDKSEAAIRIRGMNRLGLAAMRFALIPSLLSVMMADGPAQAQDDTKLLSPSEAYRAALLPLEAARAEQDDLTEADKFALGLGIGMASRDCLALSADVSALATNAKELLSLGELCLFGQQYEPARASLTKYLVLPDALDKRQALLLLVRAHLGLNQPASAAAEIKSLLSDYPYDAQIHFAMSQVIDAAEGADPRFDKLALHLCETQSAITLPLLVSGKAIEGKDVSATSSALFSDAVRCAALSRQSSKDDTPSVMQKLNQVAQQKGWIGTADLAPMQAASARQMMVGSKIPLSSLHGSAIIKNTLVPRTARLASGTVILLPFTLWSPGAPSVVRDLAKYSVQHRIYAITSWSANTGREDMPSEQILDALRAWQRTLPPNKELNVFHADSFPSGIVIRDGIVRFNSVLSTQGSERLLLSESANHIEKP
jgi:hypothetical protein